ncbi:MAG: 5-oxoprolinase subunit PxpA [Saprospiraceae bacterium]|nr:5-oxoprolinase subunit PxpA [Saprospiraceae bacterium]
MDQIDLNCDMGESYGRYRIGHDAAIFPYITSCNVACGFHGGDPLTIDQTIRGALTHGIQIGAHPSFPDLMGFGRQKMHIPGALLHAIVKYQVAAVKGMTESLGGRLKYVKPHGALYNMAADDADISATLLQAVRDIDPELVLMGMAGSVTEQVAQQQSARFIAEAFADRRYTDGGRLVPRSHEGAVISDPDEAAQQVVAIVTEGRVKGEHGQWVSLDAGTICVHGDNPGVIAILEAIDVALKEHHIHKKAFTVS